MVAEEIAEAVEALVEAAAGKSSFRFVEPFRGRVVILWLTDKQTFLPLPLATAAEATVAEVVATVEEATAAAGKIMTELLDLLIC